jgi:peptidoglycan hydrolase CwlO-like protein
MELETQVSQLEAQVSELRGGSLEGEKHIEEFRVELKSNQDKVRERETQIQELRFEN